jgi:hypothetical protein
MPVPPPSDESRWADAESMLARLSPESADARQRRSQRQTSMSRAGLVLVGAAAALSIVVLTRGSLRASDVPTWQTAAGWVLTVAGLVFEIFVITMMARANRRLQALSNVLTGLSRAQRRQLRAEVRGQAPVDPAHLSLARALAESLAGQPGSLSVQAGLAVLWVGTWIALPTLGRELLVGAAVVLVGAMWLVALRDASRARRFLAEHGIPAV